MGQSMDPILRHLRHELLDPIDSVLDPRYLLERGRDFVTSGRRVSRLRGVGPGHLLWVKLFELHRRCHFVVRQHRRSCTVCSQYGPFD
jgi:hypothetical protein